MTTRKRALLVSLVAVLSIVVGTLLFRLFPYRYTILGVSGVLSIGFILWMRHRYPSK